MDLIPQLSEDPLLISASVMAAKPDPSMAAVTFLHCATGASWSSTVTENAQLAVIPAASVARNVVVVVPS